MNQAAIMQGIRRAGALAALVGGALLISVWVPGLVAETPIADFPVFATVCALFAYFSIIHAVIASLRHPDTPS